jgi:hypothetical protein
MTQQEIQAVMSDIDSRFPGLRLSNRFEWTHKVAYKCYLVDKAVGQKRADPGRPISDDTIGWIRSGSVIGSPGQEISMIFDAVDLLDGSTGAMHFNNVGPVNQVFVIPTVTDVVGNGSGTNPNPPNTVPYRPYDGDSAWLEVGRVLVFDYSRRPQLLDDQSVVWTARTIHDCYMEKLSLQQSIDKHRIEWCAALGVPVIPIP